jgi:hypothetical protein
LSFSIRIFFISYFLISFFLSEVFSQGSVDEFYELGIKLQNDKEYDGALWELNKAMGMVKQNYNHPLREKIEEAIRVTKGKMVVARYAARKRNPQNLEDGLLPIENEPAEFIINQVFGKALARKVWDDRDRLAAEEFVGIGRTITVLPDGGIELEENQNNLFSLRCVKAASFTLTSENNISLHSGSYCIHTLRASSSLNISSTFVDLEVKSEQPFAFMVGVTTNGGMKLIGLLGRISLTMNGIEEEVIPGQLVFCLPEEFSRKMDVELSTLILTSKLLNSFKQAVVFQKKLEQQALIQGLRTKNRYRTTVGDVRGNKNFELNVFPED